ncbi:MAG: hypothetical protein ACI4V1_04085, partial [Eubacteriales bacterium]
ETSDGAHGVVLCHYPLLSWKSQRKNYMIHGHIHADTTMDFFPLLCAREKVLNAGVDVNGFEPVSFDELIENNRRFKENFLSSVPPVGRTEEGSEDEGSRGKGAF